MWFSCQNFVMKIVNLEFRFCWLQRVQPTRRKFSLYFDGNCKQFANSTRFPIKLLENAVDAQPTDRPTTNFRTVTLTSWGCRKTPSKLYSISHFRKTNRIKSLKCFKEHIYFINSNWKKNELLKKQQNDYFFFNFSETVAKIIIKKRLVK